VLEHVLAVQSGNEYRAVFKNVAGEKTSNVATLTVDTAPVVTANPVSKTVIAGEMTVFTAAASGSPAPAVHWKVSTDGGATWTSDTVDPGNKTDSLTVASTTPSEDGNQYRAVFASSAGNAESTAAMLTVDTAPIVTSNPASKVALEGETATFTAAASGRPMPTVQWQESNGHGWTNLAGATTDTLTLAHVTIALNDNEYRAVFTNSAGHVESTPATLTVADKTVAAVVTINPASKSVVAGESVTFIAAALGVPAPTVQWQVSTDGGSTWTNDTMDSGNNTGTLTIMATTVAESGHEYRAVFTNSSGHVESTPATLTATTPASATTSTQSPSATPTPSPPPSQPLTTTLAPLPPAPRTMLPFPIVRIAGSIDAAGAKLSLLTVQAPGGAQIMIRCRGRGCPKTESRVVASGRRVGTTLVEFRRFERSLRAGAVLEIRISKGGEIGKYTRFTIRRGKPPVRVDTCLSPAGIKPIACPSS
jgi:hypothetical protein